MSRPEEQLIIFRVTIFEVEARQCPVVVYPVLKASIPHPHLQPGIDPHVCMYRSASRHFRYGCHRSLSCQAILANKAMSLSTLVDNTPPYAFSPG